MSNKTQKAFTFAELMIVVAMIGIIASFMIPALLRAEPNETALNYKKAFFAIEQAIYNIINDTELYPDDNWDGGLFTYGDLRFEPTLDAAGNVQRVPNPTPQAPDNEDVIVTEDDGTYLCENLANAMNTVGLIQCSGGALANLDNANMTDATTNFTLTNGVSIGGINADWIQEARARTFFITLCVDINNSQGPNRGCAIADRATPNRDQFRVRINNEGRVYTESSIGPNNFYMENRMLLNPREVTKAAPLNEREENEVVNAANNTIINPPNCAPELGYVPVDDGNACLYTAGYTEMHLRGRRVGANNN